jgi:hypothetical protein
MTELLLLNRNAMFNDTLNSAILTNIAEDSQSLKDYIVPQNKLCICLKIENDIYTPSLQVPQSNEISGNNNLYTIIHSNAISQMGEKIGIPSGFINKLHNGDVWEKLLFQRILNDHFDYVNINNPVMVRISKNDSLNTTKAYLSNSYERYNSFAVLTQFIQSFYNYGLSLSHAYFDGIRYFVELTSKNNPIMIDDQIHYFAIQFRNSDYGRGALDIRFMLIKQICTNGMVMQSALRKIHRGRKIDLPGDSFMLSEDTLHKETEAKKSLIKDIAGYVCSERCVNDIVAKLNKANGIDIPVENVIEKLPNIGATKGDIELVQNLLMNNNPKSGVCEGGNVVRVANAVSYIANRYSNTDAEAINKYREMSGNLIEKFIKN